MIAILALPSHACGDTLEEAIDQTGDLAHKVGKTLADTGEKTFQGIKNIIDDTTGKRSSDEKRQAINMMAKETMLKLIRTVPPSRKIYDRSYGYAVFDTATKSFLLTSGSGTGIAVEKNTGNKIYMKMLSLGANIGAGLKYSQTIFFFQDKASFSRFVDNGWEAKGNANAVFGKDSLEADVRFVEGIALYHINETGILLDAHIAGTKYWKDSTLNQKKNS